MTCARWTAGQGHRERYRHAYHAQDEPCGNDSNMLRFGVAQLVAT